MAKSFHPQEAVPPLKSFETQASLQESQPDEIEKTLLKTRLEKKLSRRDVARMLCLTEGTIQALEEERWEDIPQEKTYVLGFINAYGKILKVPTGPVLERYKTFTQEAPLKNQDNWGEENEIKAPKLPSKGILWISCGICLLIVFFFTPYFRFPQALDLSDELSPSHPVVSEKNPSSKRLSLRNSVSLLIASMKPFSQLPEGPPLDGAQLKEEIFGSPDVLLEQTASQASVDD